MNPHFIGVFDPLGPNQTKKMNLVKVELRNVSGLFRLKLYFLDDLFVNSVIIRIVKIRPNHVP